MTLLLILFNRTRCRGGILANPPTSRWKKAQLEHHYSALPVPARRACVPFRPRLPPMSRSRARVHGWRFGDIGRRFHVLTMLAAENSCRASAMAHTVDGRLEQHCNTFVIGHAQLPVYAAKPGTVAMFVLPLAS